MDLFYSVWLRSTENVRKVTGKIKCINLLSCVLKCQNKLAINLNTKSECPGHYHGMDSGGRNQVHFVCKERGKLSIS